MTDRGHEEEIEPEPRPPAPMWLVYLGVGAGIVLIFGLVTWALGLGPFAYRQIFYGTSEIYILNMTHQPVEVALDKGTGLKINPEAAERTPILGGTTTLTTRREDGTTLETLEVFVDGQPMFYNVGGERCLVLSDVSSFYLPGREKGIQILQTYPKGTQIIPLPHDRIIWPRQTLRDQVVGAERGVAWIEIVACALLDAEERHVLESHLNIKLTERKKHEQALEKQRELQRQMLQGGTEAIDQHLGLRDQTGKATDQQPDAGSDQPDAAPPEPTP